MSLFFHKTAPFICVNRNVSVVLVLAASIAEKNHITYSVFRLTFTGNYRLSAVPFAAV
jgi:hypothetical protein